MNTVEFIKDWHVRLAATYAELNTTLKGKRVQIVEDEIFNHFVGTVGTIQTAHYDDEDGVVVLGVSIPDSQWPIMIESESVTFLDD